MYYRLAYAIMCMHLKQITKAKLKLINISKDDISQLQYLTTVKHEALKKKFAYLRLTAKRHLKINCTNPLMKFNWPDGTEDTQIPVRTHKDEHTQ